MASFVLHLDLDQFLAAVEMLRRPELRGRPVIVGGDGDPTKRGVVSTCSYEARSFGVRSGMPLRTALKRCPDAVFLPVDAPTYLEASRRVMDALRSFGFVVQEMGWDEAFIAVETDEPEDLARQIQQRVLERTELWCSIGIGDNKLQAKIATEEGKPAGVFTLTSDRWAALMGPRATDALWGIGAKTARRLAAIGIGTVDELASADLDELAAAFGPSTGPWLARLARGEDASPVSDAPWVPKGVSRERTFQQDLATSEEISGSSTGWRSKPPRTSEKTVARRMHRGEGSAGPLHHQDEGHVTSQADDGSRQHRGRSPCSTFPLPRDRPSRTASGRPCGVRATRLTVWGRHRGGRACKMRLNAMRKRSCRRPRHPHRPTGLLTATPALASYTVPTLLFPNGGTIFFSPFS